MKRIDAIIQPHRLRHVVLALHELPRFPGFTIVDAHGQGRGKGSGGHFVYDADEGLVYHKRRALMIVCEDKEARYIAELIAKAAHTGRAGDGLVTISDLGDVIRVRDARAAS
ncbi:MAG: P-II family nitrogen regulator [Alphaproteobacteria bacterium]|nr:P-II family nitrogen regulator [Reyranella sp.]MBL6940064.1 P-II family nitrogen regulator [Alphaproteobacteria bacterium]MBL7100151.1 P-II family nitrogen regulator [Alphaproteobacteria bacterium]